MNKGRGTCEVLKGIRLQIARENCIEYQTEECQFEGNCSGTCPKCEADIRYLEKELVKQNKLGKAVVIAGLSVGILGIMTGCGQKTKTQDDRSSFANPNTKSISAKDSIFNKNIVENKKDTLPPKCTSPNKNIILPMLEGDVIKISALTDEKFEMFDEPFYEIDIIDGVVDLPPMGGIESEPVFPGNFDSLQNFIKKEVLYPEKCKKDSITGVVLIEFAVEKDGTVTNVKVIQSAHPELDAEAIRVVKDFPKFKPGESMGEPIRTIMQVPIRFTMK